MISIRCQNYLAFKVSCSLDCGGQISTCFLYFKILDVPAGLSFSRLPQSYVNVIIDYYYCVLFSKIFKCKVLGLM